MTFTTRASLLAALAGGLGVLAGWELLAAVEASALVQGIKVGIDLLRSRRRSSDGRPDRRRSDEPREPQEEELFI